MKNRIALGVSMMMLLTMSAMPVSAADDNRNAVITTEVAPAYIVTIPTNMRVPFNQQKTDFGAVTLTKAQLEPNKCVKVTMQCDNLLDNKADAEKTIPYTIYEGKADATGNVFTTASYLSAGEKTDLTIGITQDNWNKAYAGEYEDTVTFQIEYTDQ